MREREIMELWPREKAAWEGEKRFVDEQRSHLATICISTLPFFMFYCFVFAFLFLSSLFSFFFYFLSFFVIQRKQERSWSIFLTDSQRSRWCVRPIMRQTDPPLSVPSAQLKASSSGSRANDGAMGRKAISNDPDEDVSNVV